MTEQKVRISRFLVHKHGKYIQYPIVRAGQKNPIGQKVKMSGKSVREEWY